MYTPPHFREEDTREIRACMRAMPLATLVTMTSEGLIANPLPLHLVEDEGEQGVLYGHVARANSQWRLPVTGEALAIFMGPDAYVSPSYYPSKRETHKVVPTWNYVAVHAHGLIEFFEDPIRLHELVSLQTDAHEKTRGNPWSVTDAPDSFIQSQLRGIVGLKLTITRLEAKRKLSQNRNAPDRSGVIEGLENSEDERERAVARLISR